MDHEQLNAVSDPVTIDLGPRQLQAAPPAEELAADQTDSVVDWDALNFRTTAELEGRRLNILRDRVFH